MGGWTKLQDDHASLLDSLRSQRVESQARADKIVEECARANSSLQAEVTMVAQERNACREERRSFSTALLQHRQEVSKHRDWLFSAMDTVVREREGAIHQAALEGAKLDATRRASETTVKNAAFERTVVTKELAALSEHQRALAEQRAEVQHEREKMVRSRIRTPRAPSLTQRLLGHYTGPRCCSTPRAARCFRDCSR